MSHMRQNDSTRSAIIDAAFLVLNEDPAASLADVAARAGVGRATLHRHFSSRQDLILALAKAAMDELDRAVAKATAEAASHTEGLCLTLQAVIPLATRQWFLAHEDFDAAPDLTARYEADQQELYQAIEAARAEGGFAADLPTRWIVEVYENLIYAGWSMVRAEEATTRQAADMAWRTFIKGVSA